MTDKDLTTFIEETVGDSRLRVETDFGGGFVRLRSTEAERRQAAQDIRSTEDIIIELLRNSRDAGAHTIFLAFSRDEYKRTIVCIDDGTGIPTSMHERIFEPRVTSKLDTADMDRWGFHGRGMALYSIAVNAEDARVVASDTGLGSSLKVQTDLKRLQEKTDQSTFPIFKEENGVQVMRGPKNGLRTAAEFALEHRNEVTVYFGSQVEIAAVLYRLGTDLLTPVQRAFSNNMSSIELIKRLAMQADPASFSRTASALGLEMSERTARRILDGTIKPPVDLLTRLQRESFDSSNQHTKRTNSQTEVKRHISFADSDLQELSAEVVRSFGGVAHKYYLDPEVEPRLSVQNGHLVIHIPLISEDEE